MTREQEIARHALPIGVHDVLAGVCYALAFDAKGRAIDRAKALRRCRRTLSRVAGSIGHRPRTDGAVTLDPLRRALQDRGGRMARLVEHHCTACPFMGRGECAGAGGAP
jgi:hypothetical protein